MSYSIIIGTSDRTTLLMAGTLSYTLQANHDDTASCALKTTAASYIPSVGESFYVYESVDAENKYGGVINSVTIEKLEAGSGTSKTIKADINVSPFKAIASRRTVNYSETSVTAKYVVQRVISALSTENITEGTVNTGAADIGEYDAPLNTCAQVMDDMCTASGYKWWIDPDKKLHFMDFDTVVNVPYQVTETGNYTVNSYSYDIDQYANKIFVQGHSDVTAVITRQDTAEQTARAAIEGGSGIYGATIIDDNIVTETAANAAGDAALKWMGIVPQKLVFTAYDNLSSWYPGFRVTANLPSIGLTANTTFNIDSVTTSDQGTYFQAMVGCSIRKDTAFSTAHAQTGIEFLAKLVNETTKPTPVPGTIIDPTTSAIYTSGNVYVMEDFPATAPSKSVLIDIGDPTYASTQTITTNTVLTWASEECATVTGTVQITVPDPSSDKYMDVTVKDHTGVVYFEFYNGNASNGMVTIIATGGTINGAASYVLWPKKSVRIRTGIGTNWEVC